MTQEGTASVAVVEILHLLCCESLCFVPLVPRGACSVSCWATAVLAREALGAGSGLCLNTEKAFLSGL